MLKKLLLNVAIEFGPLIAFFIAAEVTTFIKATGFLVILTIISLVASVIERKKVALFPIIVAVSIIGFGAFTLFFKDPFYLIIKDTLYNGLFAIILIIGLLQGKGYLKYIFGDLFAMNDKGWYILTFRWMILFVLLTVSNEIVRIYFSSEEWVMYKSAATLITIVFALYQFKLAKKERLPEATPWGMRVRGK